MSKHDLSVVEMTYWIVDNAPDTKMIAKDITHFDTIFDETVVFRNIHPDIDGLTRPEVSKKLKDGLIPAALVFRYAEQLGEQMSVGISERSSSDWCAERSDASAVHFKLRFPTVTLIKD